MQLSTENMADLVDALAQAYALKVLPRTGWLQNQIPENAVESVASHSWGMCQLFLLIEPNLAPDIDSHKLLKMLVIHDLAESQVGDITPDDGISLARKHEQELAAIQALTAPVEHAAQLQTIWLEFEAGVSREARIAKRLDKLDMLMQAYIYEHALKRRLDTFWQSMERLFQNSECWPIFNYILLNRYKNKD